MEGRETHQLALKDNNNRACKEANKRKIMLPVNITTYLFPGASVSFS